MHLQIVDAVAAGDADRAEALARQHVMGALDILRRSRDPLVPERPR
jgi:DNA-binding GntR family transcriptional regulator